MSVFAHIFLFVLGVFTVSTIFQLELKRYHFGNTGRYVKTRKAICTEQEFIAKLKMSILRSFVWRFVLIGLLACAAYAYAHMIDKGGNLLGLSGVEYMSLWVSGAMVAMCDRASTAIAYGYY